MQFLLSYSPELQSQVWILKTWHWSIAKSSLILFILGPFFPFLFLAWENSRHDTFFMTPPLVSLQNEDSGTSVEIPYWWHVTYAQVWVVLLVSWFEFPMLHNQSEALPRRSSSAHTCFSEFILWRNEWWKHEMSAVFSGCFFYFFLMIWHDFIPSIIAFWWCCKGTAWQLLSIQTIGTFLGTVLKR